MPIGNSEASVQLATSRRSLMRRFFARIGYAYLLGLSAPVFGTLFDLIFSPNRQFAYLVPQFAAGLALVVVLNTVSIGIVTFISPVNKRARPPWWLMPTSMGLLAGFLLVILHLAGMTPRYNNEVNAFVVGAIAGLAVGVAYTLSIPGIRQDTLIKQARRSVIIGAVVGVQYGVYWMIKEAPQAGEGAVLLYNTLASIIGVPVVVIGMLLSFVLGIELGDRYVER
jgi:hypothetical protein